jgi:hypothetical protein
LYNNDSRWNICHLKKLHGSVIIYDIVFFQEKKPVFGKNAFRPTLKPKRKPEKNFKFGSSLHFGPVRKGRNAFFPETHFFQRLEKRAYYARLLQIKVRFVSIIMAIHIFLVFRHGLGSEHGIQNLKLRIWVGLLMESNSNDRL